MNVKENVMDKSVAELKRLGDLLEWAGSQTDEPWSGEPDYQPNSAMAQWVKACEPSVILALIEKAEGTNA